MASDRIVIRGAREHNLKSIDLEIPRDQLVVITGLSGSGKSSLAFDTIYAEGQRRYVESLSAYARQFLEQMEKPEVDSIEGLSPAISIEQKTTSKNPRSTVGTVTEIYDYFRVLFARVGVPHCPSCDRVISAQTVQQMVDRVLAQAPGTRLLLLAPVVRGRKGEYKKLFFDLRRQGYTRVRVNGVVRELGPERLGPSPGRTLKEGALAPWAGRESSYFRQTLQVLAKRHRFSLDTPWRELRKGVRQVILHGEKDGGFEGVVATLERRYRETTSEDARAEIQQFMAERPCPACGGSRLRRESLGFKPARRSVADVVRLTIKEAAALLDRRRPPERAAA